MLQEDTLLAGSIADNISFFDADLDLERVRVVAKMARIHEDIERLPMKYWTLVGDLGSTLPCSIFATRARCPTKTCGGNWRPG